MRFLDYAPILHISAATGERLPRLLETIDTIAETRRRRVPGTRKRRNTDQARRPSGWNSWLNRCAEPKTSDRTARVRTIVRRGERQGLFWPGVDPVQLYISIAGEGYFYLSNRYTLSRIFGRDLMTPRALAGRARHIRQTILNAVRR